MNMRFQGGKNATPIVDEDDPARRKLTIFSKNGVRRSFKCRIRDSLEEDALEYGFYEGHIEIENPVQVKQLCCCERVLMLLRASNNPKPIIQQLLSYQSTHEYTT